MYIKLKEIKGIVDLSSLGKGFYSIGTLQDYLFINEEGDKYYIPTSFIDPILEEVFQMDGIQEHIDIDNLRKEIERLRIEKDWGLKIIKQSAEEKEKLKGIIEGLQKAIDAIKPTAGEISFIDENVMFKLLAVASNNSLLIDKLFNK